MNDKPDKPKKPSANGAESEPREQESESEPVRRLPSFRPPRDLTLTIPKKTKKVFTPNLTVARSKNRGPPPPIVPESKETVKEKKERKHGKKDGKPKPKSNIIRTTGIFSEGVAKSEAHSSRASTSYGKSYSDPAPAIPKPTLKAKNIKVDKAAEDKVIESLFSDQDGKELESEDFQAATDIAAPVQLPMNREGWARNQTKVRWKIKEEVIVKQEPADDDYCPISEVKNDEKPTEGSNTDGGNHKNVLDMLTGKDGKFVLLQLPDTLPGLGRGADDPNQPSTSADDAQPKDGKCTTSDLKDGCLGFLRVHKSGKLTFKSGDIVFEVGSGTTPAFYQEVVSIAVDENSETANIIPLGPVNDKVNITPNWEDMFSNMTV